MTGHDTAPPSDPRKPTTYSGIKARPTLLRDWMTGVISAALVQTALLGVLANIGGVFLLLMLPLLLMINPIFLTYLGVLLGFVIGSAVAGHVFPHYAFYRCGLSFLFISVFDVVQVNLLGRPGLFVEQPYNIVQLIPFAGLGALVCAFAGSLGSRWHRGIGEWLLEEWEEFRLSLCFDEDEDEEEEEEEGLDESGDHPDPESDA